MSPVSLVLHNTVTVELISNMQLYPLHSKTESQKRPDFEWIRILNGRILDIHIIYNQFMCFQFLTKNFVLGVFDLGPVLFCLKPALNFFDSF